MVTNPITLSETLCHTIRFLWLYSWNKNVPYWLPEKIFHTSVMEISVTPPCWSFYFYFKYFPEFYIIVKNTCFANRFDIVYGVLVENCCLQLHLLDLLTFNCIWFRTANTFFSVSFHDRFLRINYNCNGRTYCCHRLRNYFKPLPCQYSKISPQVMWKRLQ